MNMNNNALSTLYSQMSPSPEILGFASGILGSVSLIPQIHKSYTTKSSKDISTKTICLMYCALIIAVVYGTIINHPAIYAMNGIACVLYMILHAIKIRNEKFQDQPVKYFELENITITTVS